MDKTVKKNKTIAIVEDDSAILQLIKNILSEEGYDCLCFPNGTAFVSSLEVPPHPDLIFLDVWLGEENGKNIALKIKSNPQTQNIPIIITTASTEGAEIVKEVGAQAYVAKPFNISEIIQIVKQFT